MSNNPHEAADSNPAVSTSSVSIVPTWFWVVSIIALLWNLMGLLAFVAQMVMLNSEAMMAALPADQQEIYKTIPAWVTIAFTIAVLAGTLGCVGLMMRAKWAFPVLILSLIGVLGQQAYMFFLSDTFKVMGAGAMVMPIVVLIIAILLILFAKSSISKGWLR
jgi:hypothetical protein